jgi:hypothetical protein
VGESVDAKLNRWMGKQYLRIFRRVAQWESTTSTR